MEHGRFAQTVLLSSFITTLVLGGVLYLAREPILEYAFRSLDTRMEGEATQEVIVEASQDRIVDTIAQANPAVVSIVVTKEVPTYERYYQEWNPFGGFFGGFSLPQRRQSGTEEREVGGGSGFFVSADGMVVTNRHVVADTAADYSVITSDGTTIDATVVARDPVLDIAVLNLTEVPADYEIRHLTFGDSDALKLGQTVIAIGNALAEFNNTISTGIVSGLGRSVTAANRSGISEQLDQVIQTDAAINPGNSGGPLLNLAGDVIGVNVAASLGAENIGFALPANVVKRVIDSVKETGEIVRPFIGVRYMTVNEQLQELNNLSVDYGALITRGATPGELAVLPGSPADAAGLQAGDIILSIDGESLQNVSLAQVVREKQVGETVELTILRDGQEKTVMVTLEQAENVQ